MTVIIAFIAAIFCGIISSTPPGPINLLIADRILSNRKSSYVAFLSGIISIDILFAILAFWGYYQFFSESNFGVGLSISASIFLILLGAISVKNAIKSEEELSPRGSQTRSSFVKDYITGFFLCGSNPGFLVWWVFVATKFKSLGLIELDAWLMLIIAIGIAVGDLIWFVLYIKLLKIGRNKIGKGSIKKLRIVVAILLILLGIITLSEVLM
jgi:threonine/homoserine/homoserine lactone efflux protein